LPEKSAICLNENSIHSGNKKGWKYKVKYNYINFNLVLLLLTRNKIKFQLYLDFI